MKHFTIAVALIVLTMVSINHTTKVKPVPLAKSLDQLPQRIKTFSMVDSRRFDNEVMASLGVDHYIMRRYRDKSGYTLWLYIGYYRSQTTGAIIHSPKHCLPGSGWNTLSKTKVDISTAFKSRKPLRINRMILFKGGKKQLVHYWYQGRGRIVASEYRDRLLMIIDSLFRGRSDGALVRITGEADQLEDALQRQQVFIDGLLPILTEYFQP